MTNFLHKSLDSAELDVIGLALDQWCLDKGLPKNSLEAELCAAALVNMFREGHQTVPELIDALSRHKSLSMLDPEPRKSATL
jgi:hypothetical protein